MEIFDIHLKNIDEKTLQLILEPHDSDSEEKEESIVGTMMGEDLNSAKYRFIKWLENRLG